MSTRTALTVVGGIVGAYFGYPQLGFALGALVGGVVDPQQIQGPKIGEVATQTSAEGVPRPIIYGTYATYGNVIQCGPIIKVESTETEGKGGPEVTSERAYRTFAIRICEGPIGGVLRVWQDNKLVYDVRPGSGMLDESALWIANKIVYLGDEDQLPDPSLVSTVNADTPAYRGSAYMVFILEDQTDRQGSISQYRFEVSIGGVVEWDGSWTGGTFTSPGAGSYSLAIGGDGVMGMATYIGQLKQSTDGINWTDATTEPGGSGWVVIYSPDLQLTVAPTGSSGIFSPTIAYRADGAANWTKYAPAFDYPNIQVGTDRWWGGCWAGDRFLLVGNIGPTPGGARGWAWSLNGLTWVNSAAGTTGYSSCAYSPTLNRVVATRADYMGHSDDNGVTWTEQQLVGRQLSSVIWVAELGLFVAVGNLGINVWSTDGLTWVDATWVGSALSGLKGVAWSPARRLLVSPNQNGTSGLNAVSEDGKVWTSTPDSGSVFLVGSGGGQQIVWSEDLAKFVFTTGHDSFASNTETGFGIPVLLSTIVADIHSRCAANPATLDVSELVDLVDGFGLAGDYTGASAIDVLRPIYNFDKSLHDGKFWYPKRGAAVIETLTIDDLTEIPDTTKREQGLDVPGKLNLRYQHAASGYVPVKATAPRTPSPDFLTTGEATIEIPVVINEDFAAQTVDKMWKVMRAEQAGATEITVPLDVGAKYAEGNCIGLSLRGRVSRQRIEQMDFADWKIKLTLKPDRQSAYTSSLTGVPIPLPTLPPSTIVGETEMAILDIAARVDSEDKLGYLVAVDGVLPPWYGARYQRSFDGGASFVTVGDDIRTASVMGVLVDAIPSASEFFTDTTNTVRVQLYRSTHSLETISDQEFLSEQGAFALEKADGSWEILQYRDAAEEGGGVFALTVLHRGLLNSGPSEHLAGARFVVLDRPTYEDAQSSWIGQAITHRAVSLGASADDTTNEETATFVGRSQLEWPVAYLSLERDGSDNVSGTWTPRHRFGSDDAPLASINFQGYRVTIDDGVLPAVTIDTASPSFTYDASGLSSPVTVSVFALNRITGAGPATSGTV